MHDFLYQLAAIISYSSYLNREFRFELFLKKINMQIFFNVFFFCVKEL